MATKRIHLCEEGQRLYDSLELIYDDCKAVCNFEFIAPLVVEEARARLNTHRRTCPECTPPKDSQDGN